MASWSKSSQTQVFMSFASERHRTSSIKGNAASDESLSNVLFYVQGKNGRYLRLF